jgi:phage-related protein
MADFPILSNDFDAASFTEASENPSVAGGDTEGGYEISRARHTRRPRRTWTFRFGDITEAERVILQNFWDARFGGAGAFNWTHPITAVVYNVRFEKQSTLEFSRTGYGTNHRWDTGTITLKEV